MKLAANYTRCEIMTHRGNQLCDCCKLRSSTTTEKKCYKKVGIATHMTHISQQDEFSDLLPSTEKNVKQNQT